MPIRAYKYAETRYCVYDWNLFGDPETPIWTNEPTALNVSHASVITSATTSHSR